MREDDRTVQERCQTAHNPIFRGFYPDPSVVRVGEDYYLANTTTFWYPGIALHHSRDLVHWETLPSPLQTLQQADLRGVSAAGGIWAPDLSYADGKFWLVYTIVHSMYTLMYDTQNFLITAEDIRGPWSEPIALPSFGFDPSLFHGEGGRKFFVSMVTDHRVPKKYVGRLILQEYDAQNRCMKGDAVEIYRGEEIYLEGPHILHHGGWYYLFAADTGTGEGHGQSLLRSRRITGPYEMYRADFMEQSRAAHEKGSGTKAEHILAWSVFTARGHRDWPIQKCGHGCLVDTPAGDWYVLHLCGRPSGMRNPEDVPRFPGDRRYPIGRETAIQRVIWTEDGWLRLANGTDLPDVDVEVALPRREFPAASCRDDFAAPTLSLDYLSPFAPLDEKQYSLQQRPGYLRLFGREGLASRYHLSMLAKRWQELSFTASCEMEVHPENFKQLAGLILYYDPDNFLYLHVTRDEDVGTCISLLRSENRKISYPIGFVPIGDPQRIFLRASVREAEVTFSYSLEAEAHWQQAGEPLDASFLSDEACQDGWFSGAVVGLACVDLTGSGKPADFDWFEVRDD